MRLHPVAVAGSLAHVAPPMENADLAFVTGAQNTSYSDFNLVCTPDLTHVLTCAPLTLLTRVLRGCLKASKYRIIEVPMLVLVTCNVVVA